MGGFRLVCLGGRLFVIYGRDFVLPNPPSPPPPLNLQLPPLSPLPSAVERQGQKASECHFYYVISGELHQTLRPVDAAENDTRHHIVYRTGSGRVVGKYACIRSTTATTIPSPLAALPLYPLSPSPFSRSHWKLCG